MQRNGFTLVELAIVIVIIGLLVSGVVAGQELIKQAQIRRDVKRLNEIETAIITFKGKYNFLPGDMPSTHAERFLGVPANRGGDANGKIGWDNREATLGMADAYYFWLHLTASNILTTFHPNGLPMTKTYSSIYARFRVDRSGVANGMMYAMTGDLYLRQTVGNAITVAGFRSPSAAYVAYSSEDTRMMDEKIDDGKARSGKFRGTDGVDLRNEGTFIDCSDAAGIYINDESTMRCRILYEFGL
jgi:prepilin-type N-terminal cleavage/methylation domain-containing protein